MQWLRYKKKKMQSEETDPVYHITVSATSRNASTHSEAGTPPLKAVPMTQLRFSVMEQILAPGWAHRHPEGAMPPMALISSAIVLPLGKPCCPPADRWQHQTALSRPCQPLIPAGVARGQLPTGMHRSSWSSNQRCLGMRLVSSTASGGITWSSGPLRSPTLLLLTQQELVKLLRPTACHCWYEALQHHYTLQMK